MALIPVTIFGAQFTSAEVTFLAGIADHVWTDGQLMIGNSLTSGITIATLTAGAGITITNSHGSISIAASGSSINFVDNEIVSGTGTTFTLSFTPVLGSEHIFGEGQRLSPGGIDYSISGKVITTINSFPTSSILADYRK